MTEINSIDALPGRPTLLRDHPLAWALGALALLLLPTVLLGARSFILIHDSLEVEVVWLHLLAEWRLALAYGPGAVLPPIMNGLPRDALRSGLSVTVGVFSLLRGHPLAAYFVHEALLRVVALLGMFGLLRRHGLARPEQRGLAAAVALLWAALPVYSIYGLSLLGQPLLLAAALHLREGRPGWPAWLVCAGFPFWSSFVMVGPFIAGAWALGLLADLARRGWRAAGPATVRGAAGLALLLAGYGVAEWRLFYGLLVAREFVAHREAFDLARLVAPGAGPALREAWALFWRGHYHASAFFKGGIVLALAVALARVPAPQRRPLAREAVAVLAGLAGLCLLAALAPQLSLRLQHRLPLLHAFTLSRLYFLGVLPWVGLLVLAVRRLPPGPLAYALVAAQLPLALVANSEWTNNVRALAGRPRSDAPSFAAFTAPNLLGQVAGFLRARTGLPPSAYRVACLGLPPAVAQFNGFYTLDSYQPLYPLAYKQAFRPLIAGELAKSPALATYFDAWGNRCYLFSAELGRNSLVPATPVRTVQDWAFDAAAFRHLGGRYVLSAVRLATPARSGLRPLAEFADPAAYWRIYLYEAPGPGPATTSVVAN